MILSKDDIRFYEVKLHENGYFDGLVDAWDIEPKDMDTVGAFHEDVLEVDGYAYFDESGLVTKISGLLAWNKGKNVSILPTQELIGELEQQYLETALK